MNKLQFVQHIVNDEDTGRRNFSIKVAIDKSISDILIKDPNTLAVCNIAINEFSEDFLEFNIHTFEKLRRDMDIAPIFEYVYPVISNMTDAQICNLVRMYFVTKVLIENESLKFQQIQGTAEEIAAQEESLRIAMRDSLEMIIGVIDGMIYKIFAEDDALFNNIATQAEKMPIPDLSLVGSRPQDSKELTFVTGDYHQLNRLMLLTKLLIPIYGEVISFAGKIGIDSQLKEGSAVRILSLIADARFEYIITKLKGFIANQVTDAKITLDHVFSGISLEGVRFKVLANILVKVLPNTILLKDGSTNVMTKINSSITCGLPQSAAVKARFESDDEADDDGESKLIVDIHGSNYMNSVHKAVLIKQMISELKEYVLKELNISHETFQSAVDFYKAYPAKPNIYNEFIINLMFHRRIGGTRSIKFIEYDIFIELMVLAQLKMINLGADPCLVHFVTAKPSPEIKRHRTSVEARIGIDRAQPEYKALYQLYAHLLDIDKTAKWDSIFDTIVNKHLTISYFTYNSCALVYEKLNAENTNNSRFVYDENFVSYLISFIHSVFVIRYPEWSNH
jgi:hypothetical protein